MATTIESLAAEPGSGIPNIDRLVEDYRREGLVKIDMRDVIGAEAFDRFREAFIRYETEGYKDHPGTDPYPAVSLYREMHVHYPELGKVTLSPRVGELVARLIGTDHVRLWGDEVFTKLPGMGMTPWHQDAGTLPFDRPDLLTLWIAVDDVELDMGAMRYLRRSHGNGLRISMTNEQVKAGEAFAPEDVREVLKEADHPLADNRIDMTLRAGEAVAHHGLLIHGASANNSPRPRRAFAGTYMAADTKYTGLTHIATDHLDLELMSTIDHPDFPLVH